MAATIVNNDTLQLIYQANEIVQSCKGGLGCNFSPETKNSINDNLSQTAQSQSDNTLRLLSISSSSVLGRNIFNGYLDLAASISSVYIYQCGSTTINSTICVTNSSSVKFAQNNLVSLISQPYLDNINNIIVMSILLTISIISFTLFIIFLIIGFTETPTISNNNTNNNTNNNNNIVKSVKSSSINDQMVLPVSPFDMSES